MQERLKNSFALTAAALGNAAGVAIRFGQSPSTDGRTIFLTEDEPQSEAERESLLGDLAHECGHIRFTDFSVISGTKPFEHAIDNALEDVRIEMAMGRLYRGAERLLKVSQREAVEDIGKSLAKGGMPPSALIPLFLLAHAEGELLERGDCRGLAAKARPLLEGVLGAERTACIADIALEVRDARSTADVIALRRRITDALGSLPESAAGVGVHCAPAAGSETAPDASAAGETGSGGNSSRSRDESSGDCPDGASPEQQSDERKPEPGKRRRGRKGKKSKEGGSLLDSLNAAAEDDCSNPLSGSRLERLRGNGKRPRTVDDRFSVDLTGAERPTDRLDVARGRARLAQARARSAALRQALSGLMRGRAHTGRYLTDSGCSLDSNALAGVAVGDWRVFEHRTEEPGVSAAVEILLDLSGSMSHEGRDEIAIGACLGLLAALETESGVSAGFSVFPAQGTGCSLSQKRLGCITVLGHSERLADRAVVGRIGALSPYGGTPIREALRHGVLRLSGLDRDKRVVILATDGMIGLHHLQDAPGLLADGWHLYALLIRPDAEDEEAERLCAQYRDFFTGCAVIRRMDQMKRTLFDFARKSLVRRRVSA